MSEENKPNPPHPPGAEPSLPINAHYDSTRRAYLIEDKDGDWMLVDKESIRLRLAKLGYSTRTPKDRTISQADELLIRIQHERNVTYACSLAGFKKGVHWINGGKILVTRSPLIMESKEGEWGTIRALIDNQLAKKLPHDLHQVDYLHSWIKLADEQLRACYETGHVTTGLIMFLVGPRGCGKSLLQLLIGEILGGRTGTPFHFMSGATPFNSELFNCEHQMVEDEQPHKDLKSRVRYEAAVKQVAANVNKSCFGKGREGLTLTPFWRLTHSANDEPAHLEVLPPFEDSLKDKVILLHCRKEPMPMPAGTGPEKAIFWGQLKSELPSYLHWIRHTYQIPEELRDPSRYGLKVFFHPYVMTLLSDLMPETRLLALIDQILFMDGAPEWSGTAEELARQLYASENYGYQAKHAIHSGTGCGRLLSKLCSSHPERFSEKRKAMSRDWLIKAPPEPPTPVPKPFSFALDIASIPSIEE